MYVNYLLHVTYLIPLFTYLKAKVGNLEKPAQNKITPALMTNCIKKKRKENEMKNCIYFLQTFPLNKHRNL